MDNDNNGFTFTLTRPVTVRGNKIEILSLRRPMVRDLARADQQPGDTGFTAALLALCAGVSLADLGHVDARDFRALRREAETAGFFGAAAPGASAQPTDDGLVYRLARPFTVDGKPLTALTLRWPLVRDLIAGERQGGKVAADAALIATCAGISFDTFNLCDAEDFRRIILEGESAGFFGEDPTAPAETSSPSSPSLPDGPAGD